MPYLVERLTDLHAAPLQLQMHERQPVHEDRHIVAIRMRRRILPRARTALHRVLMDHLQAVVMDIVLVDQTDILRRAIVTSQVLYIVVWIRRVFAAIPSLAGAMDVLKNRSHSASVKS